VRVRWTDTYLKYSASPSLVLTQNKPPEKVSQLLIIYYEII
jgi:hypothetical protein